MQYLEVCVPDQFDDMKHTIYDAMDMGADVSAAYKTSRSDLEAEIEELRAENDALRSVFAKRCYLMSETHLSGYRLIIGFETHEGVQAAHEFLTNIARSTKD